jgi:hypothetical protein
MTQKENNQWFIVVNEPYKWIEDIKINNIMTPKEKAEKLLSEYLIFFPEFRNDLEYDYNIESAKTCAYITVEEIINSVDNEHVSDIYNEYWQEVKQEIEKL